MSDAKFGSWSVAESPISIEYSLGVIEEIRHEVAEGYQRLSRGGIEVGGVLYGTRDGRTVRIEAMRSTACEHARGPAFLFSDKDRAALNEQLLREKEDPQLEGLICVGWFLSHTRSEITLTESDLEIYSIFFPAPWQITLVVRPGRAGVMRAGFFTRETDGTVKSEKSYLEFNLADRLAIGIDRLPDRPQRERPERPPASFHRSDTAGFQHADVDAESVTDAESAILGVREPAAFAPDGPSYEGPRLLIPAPPRRKWPWLVAWVAIVLTLATLGVRYWIELSTPEPIALKVVDHDGQLLIGWNPTSRLVSTALRGSLEISDGGETKPITLSKQMLASGNFTYVRKSGDVETQLTLESPDGAKWQEASRYLGRAPAPAVVPAPPPDPKPKNDPRDAELAKLRQENQRQASRIQQLERTLRILQSRGIDPPKEP